MSYVYHSLYAYFDRDNVGLPGMAKFFKVGRHPCLLSILKTHVRVPHICTRPSMEHSHRLWCCSSRAASQQATPALMGARLRSCAMCFSVVPPVPPPQAASEEEREHAELLMEYQNVRGGRVRLASMLQPETEFDHSEKVRAAGRRSQGCGAWGGDGQWRTSQYAWHASLPSVICVGAML